MEGAASALRWERLSYSKTGAKRQRIVSVRQGHGRRGHACQAEIGLLAKPTHEKPIQEKPTQENLSQKDLSRKDLARKD